MGTQKKIRYIFDGNGKKTDVVIPINKYEEMLEDLCDLQAIEERKHEKSISFEEVKKKFNKKHG